MKHHTPNQFKSIGYGRHDANPSALKNLQILKGQQNQINKTTLNNNSNRKQKAPALYDDEPNNPQSGFQRNYNIDQNEYEEMKLNYFA